MSNWVSGLLTDKNRFFLWGYKGLTPMDGTEQVTSIPSDDVSYITGIWDELRL